MRSYLHTRQSMRRALLGLLFAPGIALWSAAGIAQTIALDNVTPFALSTSSSVNAVSIDPSTGNVIVRSSVGTYNSCNFVPPAVPTINSFAPSASPVQPGATFTLNWSSSNTNSCFPSEGGSTIWSSLGTSLPVSGTSPNLTAPATNGTTTFQLTCDDNNPNTPAAVQTTQVTVQTGGGGGGTCAPSFPNGTVGSWNGIFNISNPWPSYNVNVRIAPPAGTYVALSFTATQVTNQFGAIGSSGFPGDGDGTGQMSISRDPGCFDPTKLPAGCLGPATRFPGVAWVNGTGFPNRCNLTPGQLYYLNYTYASAFGSGAQCPNGICAADIGNYQQDEAP